MTSIKEIKLKFYKKIDLLDLELIISRVIKKPREFVLTHPEHKLITNYELRITNYAERRIKGEPIAYIFRSKEFYGLNFKVNKNTLVPRPETELMVEESLNLATRNSQPINLIDIGTGSGCIIITLAKLLKNFHFPFPNSQFLAIDISESALRIARQNARTHNINKKIKFLHGNLLEPVIKNKKLIIDNCKLIIVANLPYLTPKQVKNSPSIQHEPKSALEAGKDGLKCYRELLKQVKKLNLLSVPCFLFLEIDPSQTAIIKKEIKKIFPEVKIQTKKDLGGLNRLVIIEI